MKYYYGIIINVFITGTNTSIRLEFVKQYAGDSYKVFATYNPQCPLEQLQTIAYSNNNIILLPLDVTNEKRIKALADQFKNEPIDILINNAGIFGQNQDLESISKEMMIKVFSVNIVKPLLVAKYFLPHVKYSN